MHPKKLYAMYSHRQVSWKGKMIYKNKQGKEVICTEVSNDPCFKDNKFNDKQLLGEVVSFVRRIAFK